MRFENSFVLFVGSKDINMVFTILSAILHLTNIRFSHDDETDGVFIDDEYPLEVGPLRRSTFS